MRFFGLIQLVGRTGVFDLLNDRPTGLPTKTNERNDKKEVKEHTHIRTK